LKKKCRIENGFKITRYGVPDTGSGEGCGIGSSNIGTN
jgi:hypothetical protein